MERVCHVLAEQRDRRRVDAVAHRQRSRTAGVLGPAQRFQIRGVHVGQVDHVAVVAEAGEGVVVEEVRRVLERIITGARTRERDLARPAAGQDLVGSAGDQAVGGGVLASSVIRPEIALAVK